MPVPRRCVERPAANGAGVMARRWPLAAPASVCRAIPRPGRAGRAGRVGGRSRGARRAGRGRTDDRSTWNAGWTPARRRGHDALGWRCPSGAGGRRGPAPRHGDVQVPIGARATGGGARRWTARAVAVGGARRLWFRPRAPRVASRPPPGRGHRVDRPALARGSCRRTRAGSAFDWPRELQGPAARGAPVSVPRGTRGEVHRPRRRPRRPVPRERPTPGWRAATPGAAIAPS